MDDTTRTQRRLARSRDERLVAGVCGGIGRYLGVDPLFVRIGAVVLTITGGAGIVLYLLAWLFLPEDGEDASIGERVLRPQRYGRIPPLAGIALVAIGLTLLVDDLFWWDGHLVGPGLLVVLGVALLLRRRPDEGDEPPAPPPVAPPAATEQSTATATQTAPQEGSDPPFDLAPLPAAEPPGAPRQGRRTGPPVVSMTVGALFLGAGLVGLAAAAGSSVSLTAVFAGGLLLVGAALVASAWWGRARGLVWVGLLLLGALSLAAILDVPFEGGFGERTRRPETLEALQPEYRLAAGDLTVDLDRLDLRGRVRTVDASVGFGQLTVIVPADADVAVRAEAGAGEISLFGRTEDGLRVSSSASSEGVGPESADRLVLDLAVGMGEIRVVRGG